MFSSVAAPECSTVSDYTPGTEKLNCTLLVKILNGTLNFLSMLKVIKTFLFQITKEGNQQALVSLGFVYKDKIYEFSNSRLRSSSVRFISSVYTFLNNSLKSLVAFYLGFWTV